MKTTISVLLLLISVAVNAQKVTLNGDTILKDGTPYAILSKDGKGLLMNFVLKDITSKEVARIRVSTIDAPQPKYAGEKITFWTVDFFTDEVIGEAEIKATNKKQLAELIIQEHLFDGGVLNISAVKFFIKKNKNQFTKPEKDNH
jgi:hypothetical protein